MKKALTTIGILFAMVLIYTSYATVDQYLFKPTTTNYQGALKSVRMDTDGRVYTTNTNDVENQLMYMRREVTLFDSTAIPDVTGLTQFYTVAEQPAITYFTGGVEGQTIYIKARLDSLFITDSDSLECGSASLTLDTNSIAVFRLYGSNWSLVSVMNVNTDNN